MVLQSNKPIVFPQSHVPPKGLIQQERMEPKVRKILFDLQSYENTTDMVDHLATHAAESDTIKMVLTRYGAFPLQPPAMSNRGN
jgi:hypothetical protein